MLLRLDLILHDLFHIPKDFLVPDLKNTGFGFSNILRGPDPFPGIFAYGKLIYAIDLPLGYLDGCLHEAFPGRHPYNGSLFLLYLK